MDWSQTRITCSIDLDGDGKRWGDLRLRYSSDRYALGFIPVPIAVVRNGAGPTVLLVGGNHGDEFEGPVALLKLVHGLDPGRVRGRIIVLPCLNAPAVWQATRTSPIDGGNMNRAFPGDPDGGPTAMLAHLVDAVLLPDCDAAIDLHAGGKASYFTPCALVTRSADAALFAANLALGDAFDAPLTVILGALADDRSLNRAADRRGVAMIAAELGGGGAVSQGPLAVAERGVARALAHVGVLPDATIEPAPQRRRVEAVSAAHYVHAPTAGIFEPRCEAGDDVAADQIAGHVHPVTEPERPAIEVRFSSDGVIIARAATGLVERGTMLATLGTDVAA